MSRHASASLASLALTASLTLASVTTVHAESTAPESTEFARGAVTTPGVLPAESHAAGLGPGGALLVGVVGTAVPIVLGTLPRDDYYRSEQDLASVALGIAVGVTFGPAAGLASGGRSDLAMNGMLIRGAAFGLSTGAVFAAAGGAEAGAVTVLSAALCVAGLSAVHDLLVTPEAVTAGRPRPRAALGVRPDGMLAVQVKF